MNIEDVLINQCWICIKDGIENDIYQTLEFDRKNIEELHFTKGYELIKNTFNQKLVVNFRIDDIEFILSKYYFRDHTKLEETVNKLSTKSKEVRGFGIDTWSNFYCYSKSINGELQRLYFETDDSKIVKGQTTQEELNLTEAESANRIFDLFENWIKLDQMEIFLENNKVKLLK